MIETRRTYKRQITADRDLRLEVIYDDDTETKTYVSVSDDTGLKEFLLIPEDLRALSGMLTEAFHTKLDRHLKF